MTAVIEFIHARGEYASFLLVLALLWLAAPTAARLFVLRPRDVVDLFINAAIAFIVAGRLTYLALEAPRTLLDPLVVLRFQAGIEPVPAALAAAAVALWHTRGQLEAVRWATLAAGAVGLLLAAIAYDLACPLRDACYGAEAPAPVGFRMSGLTEPRLATPLIEAALLLATAAGLLALARRLPLRTLTLLLVTALALTRAALTPASALGADALGPETIALLLLAFALAALAATVRPTPTTHAPRAP